MITTADVTGPRILDEPDKVFLRIVANNGAESRFSLFALDLKKIPQAVELHGRVYERDGNSSVFNEAQPPVDNEHVSEGCEQFSKPK